MKYDETTKELVILRLKTVPSNISFSIGDLGNFTRDELIREVKEETSVGEAAVKMELTVIQKMPLLAKKIAKRDETE